MGWRIITFLLVLLIFSSHIVNGQNRRENQNILRKIEELSVREHVSLTLLWASQSLWNTKLINRVISQDTTELGPTIRFSVADSCTFSDVVETVGGWMRVHEQISIVQPWTNQEGSNILLLRTDEPAKLLIGITYYIEAHHLIIFVGENLMGF